jgi:DNA-binding NarL/FixJ family response regulator
MTEPIRVVVADDHPLFREGLAATIDSLEGAVLVGEASTGTEAVEVVRSTRPDVIVMDLNMPEMSGIDATRRIKIEAPQTAVLVVTMAQDDGALQAALDAGAAGYLLKEADRADIARALSSVAAGEAVFGAGIAGRVLSFAAGRSAGIPAHPEGGADMTPRELEVLELLAAGLTNAAIATELFLSEKTVRNYVSSLFTKLGVGDRGAAVARARDAGFGSRSGGPY